MKNGEIFKPIIIDNEKTIYSISSLGRVINTKRKTILTPHKLRRYKTKIKSSIEDDNKYIDYALYVNGKYHYIQAHRLVAEYFIPIPEKYLNQGLTKNDLVVDHKDNIRYHNYVDNLEWMTQAENNEKTRRLGRSRFLTSIDCVNRVYSEDTLDKVGKLLEENKLTMSEISNITGVPYKEVNAIKNGDRYVYLFDKYNIQNYNVTKNHIYTDEELLVALEYLSKTSLTYREIHEITGINKSVLKDIAKRRIHKDLSKNFDLSNR